MPYIKEERRESYDGLINALVEVAKHNCRIVIHEGDINYIITTFLVKWLEQYEPSYFKFNAVVGVLECIKQELYRRLIVPYEKKKCKENTDVY